MVQAILGKQYTLQSCLEKDGRDWTFNATDPLGHPYRVKFIADPDRFFDELAVYYSADDQACLSPLVYNYPAYIVSNDSYIFDDDLVSLLGFAESKPFDNDTKRFASPLATMGALVFKDCEDPSLIQVLKGADSTKGHQALHKLVLALQNLHESGEAHGALTPENVHYNVEQGCITLAGLRLGSTPADDIYHLARHFLACVVQPGTPLHSLYLRCLHGDPNSRPGIDELALALSPKRVPIPLLATIAALLLLSFGALTFFQDPQTDQTENHVLVEVDVPDLGFHERMQRQYAKLRTQTEADMPIEMIPATMRDLERPIAIMNHSKEPTLIGHTRNFKLGDSIRTPEFEGLLVGMTPRHLVIEQGEDYYTYRLPRVRFYGQDREPSDGQWLVWPQAENLKPLLKGLAEMGADSHQDLVRSIGDRQISSIASVHGIYHAKDADAMLTVLSGQVARASNERDVQGEAYAFHMRLSNVPLENATLGGLTGYLGRRLGMEISVPENLKDQDLPSRHFKDILWQEILDQLQLRWTLEDGRIIIHGFTDTI